MVRKSAEGFGKWAGTVRNKTTGSEDAELHTPFEVGTRSSKTWA